MGGYLSDFITGRSLAEGERAVAVVIVPARGGWPDAVEAAAYTPIYPHDRFVPLSFPLQGKVDDRGFFAPDPGQHALDVLLETAGKAGWKEFDATSDPSGPPLVLSHPNPKAAELLGMREETVPGYSVMHASTYASLKGLSGVDEDEEDAAARAAEIVMDASARYAGGDDSCMLLSEFGSPRGRVHETLSGKSVEVPEASFALSDNAPCLVSRYARMALERMHKDSHLTDGAALRATFAAASGLQRLGWGMMALHRYLVPSCFARHDNTLDAAAFHASEAAAALSALAAVEELPEAAAERALAVTERVREAIDDAEREIGAALGRGPSA